MMVPPAAGDHAGRRGAGEDEDGADQDVEHALLVGQRPQKERRGQAEARVVHEDVDRPRPVAQAVGDPLHLLPVAQVRGERFDLDAVPFAQPPGDLFQANGVPGDQDEPVTVGGEPPRESVADAGSRPCDKRGGQCPSIGMSVPERILSRVIASLSRERILIYMR